MSHANLPFPPLPHGTETREKKSTFSPSLKLGMSLFFHPRRETFFKYSHTSACNMKDWGVWDKYPKGREKVNKGKGKIIESLSGLRHLFHSLKFHHSSHHPPALSPILHKLVSEKRGKKGEKNVLANEKICPLVLLLNCYPFSLLLCFKLRILYFFLFFFALELN